MCLTVGSKTNFSEIFRSLHELKINKIAIETSNAANLNLKDYVSGFGLPRRFYTSAHIYEYDIKNYWTVLWILKR